MNEDLREFIRGYTDAIEEAGFPPPSDRAIAEAYVTATISPTARAEDFVMRVREVQEQIVQHRGG